MFFLKMKRTLVRTCWLFLPLLSLLTGVLSPAVLDAAPPQWWYDRGVVDPTQTPNDYAAVNQGQVKFIAEQAMSEMDAHLPGGTGDIVHTLVATWGTPTATTNGFTAVNLGQLKALARPFYDRLELVGYANAYPWSPNQSLVNNYAAANIGQVKNLFSFDLTAITASNDLNSNGIADWWEQAYDLPLAFDPNTTAPRGDMSYLQAFQQGLNPNDFYNGQAPSLSVVGGDQQTAGAGGFVPQALAVQVYIAGQIAANAPVTFTVTQNGGLVQTTMSGTPASLVRVRTNAAGIARTFFGGAKLGVANTSGDRPITRCRLPKRVIRKTTPSSSLP